MTDHAVTNPPPAADPRVAGATRAPRTRAAALLAALSLAWLAGMLWAAHHGISADVGAVALATAASSLPSVVAAGLVAGAAVGLLAAGAPRRGAARAADRPGLRWGAALIGGATTGVAAGALFVLGSGTDPARMAVAGTLAAGATVGGALAGVRSGRIVAGAVAGALGVFAVGFLLGLAKAPLHDAYGTGADEAARLGAATWFAVGAAAVSGVTAGLIAYRVLGGGRRNPALGWPAYLVAGAGPGAMLLITEVIVRTGGAQMLGLVRQISDADRALQAWAEGSRVNNALVVLFVGAIAALVAHGRTLGGGPPTRDDPSEGTGSER